MLNIAHPCSHASTSSTTTQIGIFRPLMGGVASIIRPHDLRSFWSVLTFHSPGTKPIQYFSLSVFQIPTPLSNQLLRPPIITPTSRSQIQINPNLVLQRLDIESSTHPPRIERPEKSALSYNQSCPILSVESQSLLLLPSQSSRSQASQYPLFETNSHRI